MKTWGYVFEDVNETQQFSPYAPRIQGIQVNHGSQTTFTDSEGYYEFDLEPGENTSIVYDESIWPVYTTPNAGLYDSYNILHNFGLNSDDPIWELSTSLDPGFPYLCEVDIFNYMYISNVGNQPTSGELTFTYDPLLTLQSASPTPISVNGNTLTFSIPELPYGGGMGVNILFGELAANLLGEELTAEYTLVSFDDDGAIANTSSGSETDTLFCAFDPNDKYGYPLGEGEEGLIPADTPLKYRIRFQNTGNLPATTVVIRDTLPETLNWQSFEPAGATHDVVITMNSDTREVVWTFNDIQLPDSASDPLGSIGTLWFDIEMNDLEQGETIENTAYIFFDQNEAIVTNTSLHTIDGFLSTEELISPEIRLYPNPVRNILSVDNQLELGVVFEILDVNGRLVVDGVLNAHRIDVTSLQQGLYLLKFRGAGIVEKFMVVK